eukprot:2545793-Pyramimonas_sp.AAC.2
MATPAPVVPPAAAPVQPAAPPAPHDQVISEPPKAPSKHGMSRFQLVTAVSVATKDVYGAAHGGVPDD